MTKTIPHVIGLLLLVLCIGCKSNPNPTSTASGETFGEPLTASVEMSSFEQVIEALNNGETLEPIKIKATVESVCQAKGCWMNLVPKAAADTEVFVKFKDYGFFVPMDISGREVIVQGKAYVEETSVDELRHYAEDEGKSSEEIAAITEPVKEYKFMATGVELLPKA